MSNLKEIDRIKQTRNSIKVIKDSSRAISDAADDLRKAKIDFDILLKEMEDLKSAGASQEEMALEYSKFNKKILEHKASIEFFEKKIKYAAHIIIAEAEFI